MKKVFLVSGLSLLVSLSAIGHTIRSQDNVNVSHKHYSRCAYLIDCPISNSTFETRYNFSNSDRTNSSTYEYNCHGRTFDNRNSWVNYSDAWVFGSGNQSVHYPEIGDVVVWTKTGTGSTSTKITRHTATIIGPWNGNNTIVSSKYGSAGEYHHELINTMNVYGNDYRVVRMNTTNVYNMSELEIEQEAKSRDYYIDSLLEKNESEKSKKGLTWQEKFKLLPKNEKTMLSQNNILTELNSKQKDINYFLSDLAKDRRVFLAAFNFPDFTEDLVTEIESGKLLLEIVKNNPELSQEIGDKLKEIIMSRSHDTVRGITMYYLSELEKISGLSWNIGDLFPEVLEKPNEMLYFDYYLNKSYSSN